MAILALEQPELAGWTITVAGTDLSERVLTIARRGRYSAGALRYVEPQRIVRWFRALPATKSAPAAEATPPGVPPLRRRDDFAVVDAVRAKVQFQALNLSRWPYPAGYTDFDLIMCENVLIYLQPEVTREAVEQFYQRLVPGGALFLGYSETLWQVSNRFELISRPETFYYRRRAVAPPPVVARAGGATAARPAPQLADLLRELNAAPGRTAGPPDPSGADLARAAMLTSRGLADLEAGRYAEAGHAFTEALACNSSDVGALVGMAQIHANQGRLTEAAAACAHALEVDALNEEAHLLNALVARQQGHPADALDHFERLLYVNSQSIAGHYHLAELHRSEARLAEAAREYRRTLGALDRGPGSGTISGLPVTMIRHACEQQLRRLDG